MDTETGTPSWIRRWWLPIGAIVVFVLAFSLIESLVRTEPVPARGSAPATAERVSAPPAPPELRRLPDGAIEIRTDLFRRTTYRMDSDDDARAMYDCLRTGFDATFGGGLSGWTRSRVQSETKHIQDECHAELLQIPIPPSLPAN